MSAHPEQLEEIEALGAIYPEEFSVLNPSEDPLSKEICQNADWNPSDYTNIVSYHCVPPPDDSGLIHIGVIAAFAMVPAYPDEPIRMHMHAEKGLGSEQISELQSKMEAVAEGLVGSQSVFAVVGELVEWVSENNLPGQDGSMYSNMMRRIQLQDVAAAKEQKRADLRALADSESKKDHIDLEELERIRRRQAGVQVTEESFIEWKLKFDAEMEALKDTSKSDVVHRLSGKQFFLQTAHNASADEDKLIEEGEAEDIVEEEFEDDEDLEEDDEEESAGVETVPINPDDDFFKSLSESFKAAL